MRTGNVRPSGRRKTNRFVAVMAIPLIGLSLGAMAWWMGRSMSGTGPDGLPVDNADIEDPATSTPPTGLDAARDRSTETAPGKVSKTGRLPLGGPWQVRVYDSHTRAPLANERVVADVLLVDAQSGTTSSALSARSFEETDAEGVAVFRRMVVGHPVRLFVGREQAPRGEVTVQTNDRGPATFDLYVTPLLSIEAGSSRLVVDGDVADDTPGLRLALGNSGPNDPASFAPGDRVPVSREPDGVSVLEEKVTIYLPTYVLRDVPAVFHRGRDTRLRVTLPPPATLHVTVRDLDGRPTPGVEVGVSSAEMSVAHQRGYGWRGVTDSAGRVEVPVYVGHPVLVFAAGQGVVSAPHRVHVRIDRRSESVTRTVLPLVPVVLRLHGAETDVLAVHVTEVDFHTRVLGGVDGTSDPRLAHQTLLATVPKEAPVVVDAEGVRVARLALLPGAYTLQVHLPGAVARDVTFVVPFGASDPLALELGLVSARAARVRCLHDGGAMPSPFDFGLIVGHRLELVERLRLVEPMAANVRSIRLVHATSGAHERFVASIRGRVPYLPADVGVVRDDGRAEGLAEPNASAATLLLPDGRVAVLPPLPLSDDRFVPLRVPLGSLSRLLVRIVDEAGRPIFRATLFVDPAIVPLGGGPAAVASTSPSIRVTADLEGQVGLPLLPGDSVAVSLGTSDLEVVSATNVAATPRPGQDGARVVVLTMGEGPDARVTLRRRPR